MSAYPITHFRVKENFPKVPQKTVIGVIRDISPRREAEPEDTFERVGLVVDEEAESEAKANPRRPRRPKPAEVAETK